MMPKLDGALLCSSRVGSDLGRESRLVLFNEILKSCLRFNVNNWFSLLKKNSPKPGFDTRTLYKKGGSLKSQKLGNLINE